MKEIEAKIPTWLVCFEDYTSLHKIPGENSKILITLLKNFNQIPDDIEGDAFGEITNTSGEFARSEGAKAESFTPQSIVKLLVEIIEPYQGKYLTLLVEVGACLQSANFVKSHSKRNRKWWTKLLFIVKKGTSNIRTAKWT